MSFLKPVAAIVGALMATTSLVAISACTSSPEEVPLAKVEQHKPTEITAFPNVVTDEGYASSVNAPPAEMGIQQAPMVAARGERNRSRLQALVGRVNRANLVNQYSGYADSYVHRGEKYAAREENAIKSVVTDPVSTFSVDVDTGAYTLVRDRINNGMLPNPDAVRVEEMINYFPYDYPAPEGDMPFSVTTDAMVTPWNSGTYLVRVGLQGRKLEVTARPPANLVFLVDVSGSMQAPDKLPLLVKSLQFMTGSLTAKDRVSIVVYAGASGVVLEPTAGDDKYSIRDALAGLQAGGSTAGGAGIQLAYQTARKNFMKGGLNRVLLATDGDFNVGISNTDELKSIIERERLDGISLTTLGFGDGNFNDELMEQLADVGNGNYAYIDSFREAKKVLGDQISSTLTTIAKDVKIQVEFNPAVVSEYRLIGYENRVLAREDFDNDKVDAGEIGAGHSVTALYEVALVGSDGRRFGDLRYKEKPREPSGTVDELAYVKLRYKAPDGDTSKMVDHVIPRARLAEKKAPSPDLIHAAAVAAYGQLLGNSKFIGNFSAADVAALAGRAGDQDAYRQEFRTLVDAVGSLLAMRSSAAPGE